MGIPNWAHGGAYVVFPYLAKKYGLNIFVETGCASGHMMAFMYPSFDKLYTIELSDWYYQLCSKIFFHFPKITIVKGDSGEQLPKLLDIIPNVPTLFWLDAHGEAGVDAGPLYKEIQSVVSNRSTSLIAIDDVGDTPERHHKVGPLTDYIRSLGWKAEYRCGKIMFAHAGNYDIPLFNGDDREKSA